MVKYVVLFIVGAELVSARQLLIYPALGLALHGLCVL